MSNPPDRKNENEAEGEEAIEDDNPWARDMLYQIEDVPSPHMCFLFGLQQAIMCIGSIISIPYIIVGVICVDDREDVRAKLLSITLFMCGVVTVLQDVIGVRLPIIQGGSHTFIPALISIMTIEHLQCPTKDAPAEAKDAWVPRMLEIQGSLILASLTQVVLGMTGALGFILQFVGPLTIAPTISLIGLSLTGVANMFNEKHWGMAILTAVLVLIFSLYLNKVKVPVPVYTRADGCHVIWYPLLQTLPILFSIGIAWLLSFILTETETFPTNSTVVGYAARTDVNLGALDSAPWFDFPYPFQFGVPTVSAASYVAMLAATIASVVESVGDYYACARIAGAPPPPSHAINRGIAMEGFGSIISGLVGAGHGTTSYSGNIGEIAVTKVASRAVFITAGIIMIVCGVIGKFGAVLSLIPEPVIGGTLSIVFAILASVGISTLKFTNLESARNLTVLGCSLMFGLMVPQWVGANKSSIDTGNDELDQVLRVLLMTPMFIGGTIGFVLDNTVPGSLDDRGLSQWRKQLSSGSGTVSAVYDLPFVTKYIRKVACFRYVPTCPTFTSFKDICGCRREESNEPTGTRYTYTQDVQDDGPPSGADRMMTTL